ncbi:uncharacterized protein LOC126980011 [Leptidea sinapis]|uniref:uncharacterized protein LOC126980011 n=1 Tax=Leptidea sinapis TaxID=189913 RepID=UPI0021C49B51|nr:uncharacterized protein LOC126980011 [Leptidea sinapis]
MQLYKLNPCLWNFKSPEYKIKQKRDAAYNSIVNGMNIMGFGTLEVKNKIRNLRSTYQQENKKFQESKKSGAGLSNVYTSNIKWLKEMEEVFSKDLNKNVFENIPGLTNEDTVSQDSSSATSSHPNINQEVLANTSNHQQAPLTVTTTATGNTARATKRTKGNFQAVSDLKKLNDGINSESETVFDVFGRSVALQLKNLSAENALIAQSRIQNILTEFGIKELRTTSSFSNHSYQTPSSVYSDTTNDYYQFDETYVDSPPQLPTPAPSTSQTIFAATSTPVPNVNATPDSISTNDIVAAAMFAAMETDGRQQV